MDVFVGGTREHELPFRVLEYSIKRRSTVDVTVHRLWRSKIDIPTPIHRENRSRTTFSYARFTIPEAMGDSGRAIYLDSDMVVLSDIAELGRVSMSPRSTLLTPSQSAVMVIDCAVGWRISEFVQRMDEGSLTYAELMNLKRPDVHGPAVRALSADWNCTDRWSDTIRLLHFTNMKSQPWLKAGHPLGHIWERELTDAIGAGVLTTDDLLSAIDDKFVRPSLAALIAEKPPYDDAKFVFPNDRRAA